MDGPPSLSVCSPTSSRQLHNPTPPSTRTMNSSTNRASPFSLPNRLPRGTGETTPATELTPSHFPHTSFTDFAITLVKPRPTQGRAVILSRIETHVYLDIDLPSRWNAIQLPLTKSVTRDDTSSMDEGIEPLLLVIAVRGATSGEAYNYVCKRCDARMGNMIGTPSLIDYHSNSNIITPKGGVVQVHFTFSCYSRHHRKEDEQYVYVAVAQ